MCVEAGWRLRTCGDVRELDVPTWAGSGSRERGQYGNISEAGRHGSSREHNGALWRGAVRRTSSASSYLALKVPTGEQQLPPFVRSFPARSSVKMALLKRSWSVMGQVWDAWMLNLGGGSYLQLRFGESGRESQKMKLEGKYNKGQSNFKQKSVVYEWKTVGCSITWWSSS